MNVAASAAILKGQDRLNIPIEIFFAKTQEHSDWLLEGHFSACVPFQLEQTALTTDFLQGGLQNQ